MKKAFLLIIVIAWIVTIAVNAQVYKTVQVDTAGTLTALLSVEELGTVTDLTLTGTINNDDFNTMKTLMPALTCIDLGSVRVNGDSIPANAFKTSIDSLILPSTITSLGDHALEGCGLLTSLNIPSSVISIGSYAFAGCIGLTSLIIPDAVASIRDYTFAGCSGLDSLILPESTTSIGNYAFAGCSGLPSIHFPDSTTSIGMYAFAGCNSLRSVTIPSSVDSIATYAFVGCPGLTSVDILSSKKTTIGAYAFAGDLALASVTIHPSAGTSVGNYAFVSCSGLKILNMASPSVTEIGEGCFINNIIDSLVFPSSLTSIGKVAFVNSDSMRTLTFLTSSGVTIGENAFTDCSNLNSVTFHPSTGSSIGYAAFQNCTSLDSVTIYPSSGFSIGEYVFAYCSSLASLNMHSPSVDSIGERCFIECKNLTSLTLPSSLAYIGGYAFSNCNITGSLTMPASLTYIGEYAFSSCQGIDSLTFLPTSGTSVGEMAFYNCDGLISVRMFSPSVDTIETRGFDDSENLTDVILPSSLSSMAPAAFGRCYGLRNIRINKLIPPVIPESNNVFNYVSTGAVNLYVPAGTKDAYQAAEVWRRFNIIEFDLQMSVSPDTLAIADTAGSATFDIQSSTNWQVISDQLWLTADTVIGIDTARITLNADANPDTLFREAMVTVLGENVASHLVVIIQAPKPALSVSSGVLGIGPLAASTVQFSIFSNQEWTIQSDISWLAADPPSGNGNGEITMTADANPDTIAREAIVTVSTGRLSPQTIVVTQEPKRILSVSSGALSIGAQDGSTARFNIVSNTDWTIQSDQTWLMPGTSSGSGNAEITLNAEANPATSVREVTVTVSADGLPAQTVIVTQESKILSGLPETLQETIVIYPNPVKDVLNIHGAAGHNMILFDRQGRIIFSRNLCSDHEWIDLSTLSSGDYVIKVGNKTVKILK